MFLFFQERCDNYVRLIKLTLDETIKEQNSLLDGSAIHNRLKHLGVLNKPTSSLNTLNFDKTYPISMDYENKYKYLVLDGHLGIRKPKKSTSFNAYDINFSNSYNSSYKPRAQEFPTSYDDGNDSYYEPYINSKKYGKLMHDQTPSSREYQVYYFPTNKPIPQYPRQTTERFYRRKPVERYPEEEVPYWHTRYPKPVRVVEREPSYPTFNYGYRDRNYNHGGYKNMEPYMPEYRSRYFPANDNIYHDYDDRSYYYETDLGQRSFSSITRPCSPTYSQNTLYGRNYLDNSSSLFEKKIRDYAWNPRTERVEKYTSPNYEKKIYQTDYKPLRIMPDDIIPEKRFPLEIDSQVPNRQNETTKESIYRNNSIIVSPERRLSNDDSFQLQKDNDHFSESKSYIKKSETPVIHPKRISFDLGKENNEPLNRKSSIGGSIDENTSPKERGLSFGRRESISKQNDDKRRASILSNDNYSALPSKQRVPPNYSNGNSRRESLSKPEKMASVGNSFDPDKHVNFKNDVNPIEKNIHTYNQGVERLEYDDEQPFSKVRDEKKIDTLKTVTSGQPQSNIRRGSKENDRTKSIATTEKSNPGYGNQTEKIPNKKNNTAKRRESYKNEQTIKKENILSNKKNPQIIDKKLEKIFNKYQTSANESSKNIVNSPIVDLNNGDHNLNDNNNIGQEETSHLHQFVNDNKNVENNSETISPYQTDSKNETDITNSIELDKSNFKSIPKEQEPHEVINDEYSNNTNYYQDHSSDDTKEHLTHQYETQLEHADTHAVDDPNYYQGGLSNNNKDNVAVNQYDEPTQQSTYVDEKNAHDEYYYQNPTDESKEHPTENQFGNPDSQENHTEKQHANDDYYYQNYSTENPEGQPENHAFGEPGQQGDYATEHNEHDDYYYQNHPKDDLKEHKEDQQYVDPNYQGNYNDEQNAHDNYYYQNYSNADTKGQPDNQYAEAGHPGDYAAENVEHDDYYYQNHPKDETKENQVDQQYAEPEHQRNYNSEGQSDYYYEDHPNADAERRPPDQYNDHTQQENYADDQHLNDGYYYQEPNTNYEESAPKDNYDGYVDNQHDANQSYYPDPQSNNYDQQQNYDDGTYQAQQPEYNETYEQHPGDENQ